MKVFVVIDHVCEADIVIGVFSTRDKAKEFMDAHKDDPYSTDSRVKRYDCLAIEDYELDEP